MIHAGKLYKAQDRNIYFTNGNKIGRISAITYNTTTGAITATSTLNALDLLKEDYAVTISELGINLLIGTTRAINRITVTESANIYPWDMFSPSLEQPIQVRESGINAMVQKDNLVYFSAGREGNIYATDGASYKLIQKIPYTTSNRYNGGCYVHRNAMY